MALFPQRAHFMYASESRESIMLSLIVYLSSNKNGGILYFWNSMINLQQKIFSDIKKELTCQIEESLGRNVESMTCEELKDIIRKAIDKVI
ncbi:hypothetical protein [Candidatus Nitrosotalea sp. TS]|uniref:hypothetical protein n=1 Tax=Candidatus Nitrosotalea sp. TS TaxID=2341020 RepID=UPI00140B102A|nr:hypothetical protein [Candidatus Nitrosotalea sp. TS]